MIRHGAVGCYTRQLNLDRANDLPEIVDRARQIVSVAAGALDWPRVRTITLEISTDLVHKGVVGFRGYGLSFPIVPSAHSHRSISTCDCFTLKGNTSHALRVDELHDNLVL